MSQTTTPDPEVRIRAARAAPWLGLIATLVVCHPLLLNLHNFAPGDWDYFATIHEAARKTIIDYAQFPWWNPWMAGGMPLLANPQVMLLSGVMPLILLFGTLPGLKLGLALHFLIGFEGARRLASRFTRHWPFQLAAAAIFAWNGADAIGGAVGHFGLIQNFYIPWLIYFALGIGGGRANAVGLGVTEGLMMLSVIHYNNIYGLFFAHLVIAIQFVRSPGRRGAIVRRWLLASSLCAALCGVRVWTAWQFFSAYPRETPRGLTVEPALLLRALMRPWQRIADPKWMGLGWWEYCSYIGVLPVILFFASMRRGVRFWHLFALLCFTFAVNSLTPWWPGCWVRRLPLLSSMWVVTRWRFPGLLFVGLAVGVYLSSIYDGGGRRARVFALACAAVICVDLFVNTFPEWGDPFRIPLSAVRPEVAPARSIRTHKKMEHPDLGSCMYPYVRENLAIIDAYEPLLGYGFERPTLRQGCLEPGYRGEWAVDGRRVTPEYWSPNRIVIRAPRGSTVYLDQNPGCYWIVDGKRPWPRLRVFELMKQWEVVHEKDGPCVIRLRPPRLWVGFLISGLGLCVFVVLLIAERRASPATETREGQGGADESP